MRAAKKIHSCITEGQITATNTAGGTNTNIGGFTGYAYMSDFAYDKSAASLKIGTPYVASTSMNASGFAGMTENCTIMNSLSSGKVEIDNSTSSTGCNTTNIGGVAGNSSSTKYLSDKSTGDITANLKVGSIGANVRVGGFTGYSSGDTIGDKNNNYTPNIASNNIGVKILNSYPDLRVGGFSGTCFDSTVSYSAAKGTMNLNDNTYSQNNGSAYIGGFAGYIGNTQVVRCWSNEKISNVNGYIGGLAGYSDTVTFTDSYAASYLDTISSGNTSLFTNDSGTWSGSSTCSFDYCHAVQLNKDKIPFVSGYRFRSHYGGVSKYANYRAYTNAVDITNLYSKSTNSMATLKAYFAADVQNGVSHWITDDTVAYPQLASFPESSAVTAQSVKASSRKGKLALTSASNAEGASVPDIMPSGV